MKKAEFKNAFREVVSLEFSHIPYDESIINYTFSNKFNKKMEKLIKSQKKVYWKFVNTASKRVAIICVILLTMLTTACSVKTLREPMVSFFAEVYETFTRYFFEGDTTERIEKEYIITKLPHGFTQVDKMNNDLVITTVYKNGDDTIKFTQQPTSNANHVFDNENGTIITISVLDFNVDIYESENIKHAIWTRNGYFFKMTCIGDINIDSIKIIIESME